MTLKRFYIVNEHGVIVTIETDSSHWAKNERYCGSDGFLYVLVWEPELNVERITSDGEVINRFTFYSNITTINQVIGGMGYIAKLQSEMLKGVD